MCVNTLQVAAVVQVKKSTHRATRRESRAIRDREDTTHGHQVRSHYVGQVSSHYTAALSTETGGNKKKN